MIEKIKERISEERLFHSLINLAGERRVYLVGGAIRDIYLNREVCDFDFVVEGEGIEFARRFAKKVRGAFVILSKEDDEARVVFRKEIILDFIGLKDRDLIEDLKRRDFTINSIALDISKEGGLIDPFEGMKDLEKGIIRPVSPDSLNLDPLRILRAIRFALELGFKIDGKVWKMAENLSLSNIAKERISYELLRIMEQDGSYPYIKRLLKLGLLQEIFPRAERLFKDYPLLEHSLNTYKKIEDILREPGYFQEFKLEWEKYFSTMDNKRALLKLSGLFHDISKPETMFINERGEVHFYGHDTLGAKRVEEIAREDLRLSRKEIKVLKTLVARHMHLHLLATAPELTDRAIRRFFRLLENEYFGLFILAYADGYATAGKTEHLERTIRRMIQLKREDEAKVKIKRLITGDDLIEMGLKPGPIFKPILQELEDLQLEGKITTKEEGVRYLKEIILKRIAQQNHKIN